MFPQKVAYTTSRAREENSSPIPKYLYSADAKEAQSPVPDGAMFTFKERYDDKTVVGSSFDSTIFDIYSHG